MSCARTGARLRSAERTHSAPTAAVTRHRAHERTIGTTRPAGETGPDSTRPDLRSALGATRR